MRSAISWLVDEEGRRLLAVLAWRRGTGEGGDAREGQANLNT
jgi:hypothetical protein